MGERSKLMKDFWRGGELFVWMTASGVALSLLMVAGMLGLIMINGLGQFWPGALQETTLKTQETVIGQVVGEEVIPNSITPDSPPDSAGFGIASAIGMCSGPNIVGSMPRILCRARIPRISRLSSGVSGGLPSVGSRSAWRGPRQEAQAGVHGRR
jgi:hypothetical protein